MNRKLYAIDFITFAVGVALLFVAKGFDNLSDESRYGSLKWVFLVFIAIYGVVSNYFYFHRTNEAEIYYGNIIFPLVLVMVFIAIYYNPLIHFTTMAIVGMTPNIIILIGVFCMLGAHYFYCIGVHLDNVGVLKAGGNPRAKNLYRTIGAIFLRVYPMYFVLGIILAIAFVTID